MSTSRNDTFEFELLGPSGLRPVLSRGRLAELLGHSAPFDGCLGMYSVESRLLLFDPVLPTRSGSSSHLVTPVKGRVFFALAGDRRRPLAPPKGGGVDRNRFLVRQGFLLPDGVKPSGPRNFWPKALV